MENFKVGIVIFNDFVSMFVSLLDQQKLPNVEEMKRVSILLVL